MKRAVEAGFEKKLLKNLKRLKGLDVMRGRGRKRISNETVKEVTFDVIERESGSQYSASRARELVLRYYVIDLSPGLQCERF